VKTRFVTDAEAEAFVESNYWSETDTLPSVLAEHAERQPSHLAVVDDTGQRISYGELHDLSSGLAAGLRNRGVNPGDAVGVQLPNRVEASIAMCAIEKAGAVVCPLVPPYREKELDHIIGKTKMRALITAGIFRGYDHDALGLLLAERHPSLQTIVSVSPTIKGSRTVSFEEIIMDGSSFDEPNLDPNAIAAVLFTSGTEADPKGIVHSHNTLQANILALEELLGLSKEDGVFMPSPVGHGTGYGFGLRLACHLGSTLCLLGMWEPGRAAELLTSYQCAYTHGATPFVQDLLGLDDSDQFDLTHLRYFVTGGAAIPPGVASRVRDRFGCELLRLYGQTEGFMSTLVRPGDSIEKVENTDGLPVPGVEILVIGEDGAVVKPGEVGECLYRGPHLCVGFLDDPDREAHSWAPGGWFRSGDLVSLDDEGYLRVAGRKKEVINRGGYKYSPREVEDLLTQLPEIERVAVVGMPDSRLVERACAFVVPRGDAKPTVKTISAYLESCGVATFKWPERVELVTHLPTTASGKIQKFVLEHRLRDQPVEIPQ
jgi:acyl-CoA synthetase (AMP-forming)/AMP-acid ligase II